ncbi:MAG TPA: LysM domain-containing protein [Geobacteraceae bacterium]|nr:LysM domain-containing protein [Geobacteraceae bacterium]
MRKMLLAMVLVTMVLAGYRAVSAQSEEPTIYVIKKGDTLWGLSDKFLKDPHYWPDLWARNPQQITNPHLIFPGQRLKIYPDRIEIETAPEAKAPAAPEAVKETKEMKETVEKVVQERRFPVRGDGFILEKSLRPAGFIVATHQDRILNGTDDVVYTDIGRLQGGKGGARYSLFRKMDPVSHPVTSVILGYKVIPLGSLKLSVLEEKSSKAVITDSLKEISTGDFLLPYRNRKRDVILKAADCNLSGYVLESQSGVITIGSGEIVFLDLGKAQGIKAGNLVYIVREVVPEKKFYDLRQPVKLPFDVLGAAVVVETGENTSAALVVKSVNAIYRGDRVMLVKRK